MGLNSIARGFDVALATALLSNAPRPGLRMGSALFAGNRLLSVGANRWNSTHPNSDNRAFVRTIHAEHIALVRRQHYDVSGNLILYVARRRADGSLGCSKPCANCLELARLAGVSRVRYFDHSGKQEEMTI
jgi:deoxycytidylate deaminase